MTSAPAPANLRRCVLGVGVLHDMDFTAGVGAVVLGGLPGVTVSWAEVAAALDGTEPESRVGWQRLAWHLRARLLLAGDPAPTVTPYGLPVDSTLHPGPLWVRERVRGGALDVGLGLAGLNPARPSQVLPLPPSAVTAAELDGGRLWPVASRYLDEMGTLAAARYLRRPDRPLHPMGDCDVVTLLAAPALRAALTAGSRLRSAAAPMRTRGWLDLRRVDPLFVVAAAAATDADQRGFSEPLLLSAEEIVLSPGDGATAYRQTCALPSAEELVPPAG